MKRRRKTPRSQRALLVDIAGDWRRAALSALKHGNRESYGRNQYCAEHALADADIIRIKNL